MPYMTLNQLNLKVYSDDTWKGVTMNRLKIILVILFISVLIPISVHAEDRFIEDYKKWFGEEWKNFDTFFCQAYFRGGTEKENGLLEKDLNDYFKLKVKNNFRNINIVNQVTKREKTAIFNAEIWTSGIGYPIAYNVHLTLNLNGRDGLGREALGIGSRSTILNRIKEIISSATEEIAIEFYKIRGEL